MEDYSKHFTHVSYKDALLYGHNQYDSTPCAKCGCTVKFVITRGCRDCAIANRKEKSNEIQNNR